MLATSREPAAVRAMLIVAAVRSRQSFAERRDRFLWRHGAAEIVRKWNPARVLDLATGSGDLALAIARKLPHAEVTGADFAEEMLAVARRKGVQRTVVADALQVPFDGECLTA